MKCSSLMEEVNKMHNVFTQTMPEIEKNFEGLMSIVFKDGALSTKVKELISLGIAVCVRCEPCMEYHIEKAMSKGATREEVLEAVQVGYQMGMGYLLPPLLKVLNEKFCMIENKKLSG